MNVIMVTVDNAPDTTEIADVVDCLFSYFVHLLGHKMSESNRQSEVVCQLIFIKQGALIK